ncbi:MULTISPECIES: hypothetical protein [Streptomyces]|uniref:hypothetical protein n=1 Tax=Streptomyces TaxID=1883 RepID=UPI00084CA5D1|nr:MULTISPECIES: hypothetical protein [Streptomyces]TFI24252.1 hypothetical protein E4P36_23460 [Streptomyces sp. 4R-3d]
MDGTFDNRRSRAPVPDKVCVQPMKMTKMFRNTANPRRTTLANLDDAGELLPPAPPEHSVDLPLRTANPQRTTLIDAPVAQ